MWTESQSLVPAEVSCSAKYSIIANGFQFLIEYIPVITCRLFFNTIHIQFYIKFVCFTVPSVVQHFVNLIPQFTTCFGLYRPSSGV
jgi:hypothetical protein